MRRYEQACFIIGFADPSSDLGNVGFVDISRLELTSQAIHSIFQSVTFEDVSKESLEHLAASLAKHANYISTTCKSVGEKTKNIVAQRQFLSYAKDIASQSNAVVSCLKDIAMSSTTETKMTFERTSQALVESINQTITFASSDEFSRNPGKISDSARDSLQIFIDKAQALVNAACDMMKICKSILLQPANPQFWQQLGEFSSQVGESAKALVLVLKTNTPGKNACEHLLSGLEDEATELDRVTALIASKKNVRNDNGVPSDQLIPFIESVTRDLKACAESSKTDAILLSHNAHSCLMHLR